MLDAPRQVMVGQRVTITGIDEHGRFASEDVMVIDQPVTTRTSFRYVGPWWWCRQAQARAWLWWNLYGRWRR